jgi:hypothetical protein
MAALDYAKQMSRTISADQGNIRYGTRSPRYDADTARSVPDALYRGAAREFRKYRGVTRALRKLSR